MNLLLLRLIFPLYFRPKNRAKRNIHPSRRAFSLDFLNETKKGSRLQSLWFNSPAWGETNASPQITYLTHTHNLIDCPPPFFISSFTFNCPIERLQLLLTFPHLLHLDFFVAKTQKHTQTHQRFGEGTRGPKQSKRANLNGTPSGSHLVSVWLHPGPFASSRHRLDRIVWLQKIWGKITMPLGYSPHHE